jgi:hypothetical protein
VFKEVRGAGSDRLVGRDVFARRHAVLLSRRISSRCESRGVINSPRTRCFAQAHRSESGRAPIGATCGENRSDREGRLLGPLALVVTTLLWPMMLYEMKQER